MLQRRNASKHGGPKLRSLEVKDACLVPTVANWCSFSRQQTSRTASPCTLPTAPHKPTPCENAVAQNDGISRRQRVRRCATRCVCNNRGIRMAHCYPHNCRCAPEIRYRRCTSKLHPLRAPAKAWTAVGRWCAGRRAARVHPYVPPSVRYPVTYPTGTL